MQNQGQIYHRHGDGPMHANLDHRQGQHQNHHNHQGMMMGAHQHQSSQISPDQYFATLKTKYRQNRVFFWQEVLDGVALNKLYQKLGLDFMRSLSCMMGVMITGTIEMALNFQWIPARLKHITSGTFFPLLFLLFFNYNVVVGLGATNQILYSLIIATLILYLLVGFRGSSRVNTSQMQEVSRGTLAMRPYLQNPMQYCNNCNTIKFYRTFHSPVDNSCIRKYSCNSIVFGRAIGAANQFLALLFFVSLFMTLFEIMRLFWLKGSYGILTRIMFSALNGSFCWMAFGEASRYIILNLAYGVTEHELKVWQNLQYLHKMPDRIFQNHIDQGFKVNLINSVIACLGISGYQSQKHVLPSPLAFPDVQPGKTYYINWDKANFYLIPHLPWHRMRPTVRQILATQQDKMIQMFKLQMQFRQQVLNECKEEQINQLQVQQRVAAKMQAHMMKNMPQMQMPNPEQQKAMQLQMLAHMQRQFATDPDLAQKINVIKEELQRSQITPIQANMRMRQAQQQLMGRRMTKMMQERRRAVQKQNAQSAPKKGEDEQAPMAGVADDDL